MFFPFIKFRVLVTLATFQVLSNHIWLVAIVLDRLDIEHFCHCRQFYWAILEDSWLGMFSSVGPWQTCMGWISISQVRLGFAEITNDPQGLMASNNIGLFVIQPTYPTQDPGWEENHPLEHCQLYTNNWCPNQKWHALSIHKKSCNPTQLSRNSNFREEKWISGSRSVDMITFSFTYLGIYSTDIWTSAGHGGEPEGREPGDIGMIFALTELTYHLLVNDHYKE